MALNCFFVLLSADLVLCRVGSSSPLLGLPFAELDFLFSLYRTTVRVSAVFFFTSVLSKTSRPSSRRIATETMSWLTGGSCTSYAVGDSILEL